MGGSSTVTCDPSDGNCTVPSVYGTQGVPSAANIPAARYGQVSFTDKSGNFWLFSGDSSSNGTDGQNDLWKFNPSTNQWTWVSGSNMIDQPGVYGTLGVPDAGNIPGGRWLGAGWTDSSGNFWVFGGYGIDANGCMGYLNDLWKYNPVTNQWTWMNGSNSCFAGAVFGTKGTPDGANTPAAQDAPVSWTDKNGNLWLFGGQYGGFSNNLWEYNPSTNQWTWVTGSGGSEEPGVYGTMGTPAGGNTPGGRWFGASWTDNNGNLWLLGGDGYDVNGNFGYNDFLNDLWKFDPSTSLWTWMGGAQTLDQPGVYGTLGVASPATTPGSRIAGFTWTDGSGNLWLFGGGGRDAAGNLGPLNDLLRYNIATNEWTWVGGSTSEGQSGVYGTLATPAAGNVPGGTQTGSAWTDGSGNLWLFGGSGTDALGTYGNVNGVWRYQLSSATLPAATAPTLSLPNGTFTKSQTVTISDAASNATIYYSTNAASVAPAWTVYSGPITVSSTETVEAIATASGHSASAVASASYTVNLPTAAIPTFSPVAGSYNQPQMVTISDASSGATIYYTVDGSIPTTNSTQYSGAFIVATGETIQAIAGGLDYNTSPVASVTYAFLLNTTTTVTASHYPSLTGQPVTFTATVSAGSGAPVPPGVVQFQANGTALGSPLSLDGTGAAAYTANALPPGFLSITAAYTPASGALFNPSASPAFIEAVYASPQQTDSVFFASAVQTLGGGFKRPYGVAVDANANVFVADTGNQAVKEILATGGYATINVLGSGFNTPVGVALDGNSNLFVSDRVNNTVYELLAASSYASIVNIGRGFEAPAGVAVDAQNDLIVADTNHGVIKLMPPCASCGGGYGEATILGGTFTAPWGVAVDGTGNIFVTDVANRSLNELTAAANYATANSVAGSFFASPYGLAADTNGDVFVTDVHYGTLREISEVDGFSTVSGPGLGLNVPVGVAVDSAGDLFVADTYNNAVKKISQVGGNFGPQSIGTTSSAISMFFYFSQPTTLGSTAVLAQQGGPASSDFADAGTGTCKVGTHYAANTYCTVDVTFTPKQTGARTGVVELLDGASKVLALGSVQGGTAPL